MPSTKAFSLHFFTRARSLSCIYTRDNDRRSEKKGKKMLEKWACWVLLVALSSLVFESIVVGTSKKKSCLKHWLVLCDNDAMKSCNMKNSPMSACYFVYFRKICHGVMIHVRGGPFFAQCENFSPAMDTIILYNYRFLSTPSNWCLHATILNFVGNKKKSYKLLKVLLMESYLHIIHIHVHKWTALS